MTLASACSLNIFVDYDSTTRKLRVKARVFKVDAFSNGRLRYAIAENKLTSIWGHVERKMLPNYNGVVIPDTLQIGSVFVDSQSYTLPSTWKHRNCYVVVFAQRDDASPLKPVLRSTKGGLFPGWVFGDATGDSIVNVADVVHMINYLFVGGPAPDPLPTGDSNRDCKVDVADVVYLINHLFAAGPAPLRGCAWYW
jgi:hypothetical protein